MSFSTRTRVALAGALGSPGRANEILDAIQPTPFESEDLDPLTNDTGGTADGTLQAVGDTSSGDESAAINNNFTELFTQLDAIREALVSRGIIAGPD